MLEKKRMLFYLANYSCETSLFCCVYLTLCILLWCICRDFELGNLSTSTFSDAGIHLIGLCFYTNYHFSTPFLVAKPFMWQIFLCNTYSALKAD